jgi:hypothetical protein
LLAARPPAPNNNSNYGFDPLGLSKNPEGLKRFTESEVIHCRWAMLGAAGCLGVEVLGQGNWFDAPLWVSEECASCTDCSGAGGGLRARQRWQQLKIHSCLSGLLAP